MSCFNPYGWERMLNFPRTPTYILLSQFMKNAESCCLAYPYHRKKTNRAVVSSHWSLLGIFKCRDHRQDFPTIRKTKFNQTHIEKCGWYAWKFRFVVFQYHQWNTIRTRCLCRSKVGCELNCLATYIILYSFRLLLAGKASKKIPG